MKENLLSTYVLGGGSCDPKLARKTLEDYVAAGNEVLAITGTAGWLYPIANDLGIPVAGQPDEFTPTDTVIAPMDTDGLEDILKTGAVVLDLSDGLLPLELEDEDGEIPVVPDVPESLPEKDPVAEPEPVAVEAEKPAPKKRAPRSRKKPTIDPLPPAASTAPAVAEERLSIPSELVENLENVVVQSPWDRMTSAPLYGGLATTSSSVVSTATTEDERSALSRLVEVKLKDANEDVLYRVLDLLRGA